MRFSLCVLILNILWTYGCGSDGDGGTSSTSVGSSLVGQYKVIKEEETSQSGCTATMTELDEREAQYVVLYKLTSTTDPNPALFGSTCDALKDTKCDDDTLRETFSFSEGGADSVEGTFTSSIKPDSGKCTVKETRGTAKTVNGKLVIEVFSYSGTVTEECEFGGDFNLNEFLDRHRASLTCLEGKRVTAEKLQ